MDDIKTLHGVGEQRAKLFARKGIKTVEDLLYYFPREHEDRTHFSQISECNVGETVCISAKVFSPVKETRIRKNFTVYSMVIFDDTGAMNVIWYNNRYVKGMFQTGEEMLFYGRVEESRKRKELQNPVYEKADKQRFIGKIVPVYPLTGGLTQKNIQSAMEEALKTCGIIDEYLPQSIRKKYNIAEINFAMHNIHFPKDASCYEQARKRFIFEELFL
ncbi:MAG: DNA helicase RecG, partial [Clostridiales bacterium]|nr:DNA helicase RecG [Clostridiales bacterium]